MGAIASQAPSASRAAQQQPKTTRHPFASRLARIVLRPLPSALLLAFSLFGPCSTLPDLSLARCGSPRQRLQRLFLRPQRWEAPGALRTVVAVVEGRRRSIRGPRPVLSAATPPRLCRPPLPQRIRQWGSPRPGGPWCWCWRRCSAPRPPVPSACHTTSCSSSHVEAWRCALLLHGPCHVSQLPRRAVPSATCPLRRALCDVPPAPRPVHTAARQASCLPASERSLVPQPDLASCYRAAHAAAVQPPRRPLCTKRCCVVPAPGDPPPLPAARPRHAV